MRRGTRGREWHVLNTGGTGSASTMRDDIETITSMIRIKNENNICSVYFIPRVNGGYYLHESAVEI